jgi:uncharacterized protein with von Willebrand factor type A (vWA) domain
LLTRRDQISEFDRAFAAYFSGTDLPTGLELTHERLIVLDRGDEADPGAPDSDPTDDDAAPDQVVPFSAMERLNELDIAALSDAERHEAWRAIASLRVAPPMRRGASWRPHGRRGRLDMRSTIRAATRSDGEMMRVHRRVRRQRPRRVVLLVDVSGSMADYSRAVLRFAHCVSRSGRPTEVFALGTRVTRLSRPMTERDPDRALERAAAEVCDWAGGTRLGAGLQVFCDRWGQRGVARGADVVIVSDGWDRGDPALLAAQMQRLSRLAHRIVWVNPLKASDGYAPIALGMAAALPYCDRFMEGHSLHSLEALAVALSEDG